MKELWAGIKSFMQEEEGATATEYAVMLALIVLVALAAIVFLGNAVKDGFQLVGDKIDSAVTASGGGS
jgi:pilus assembly protein Flp/PilA